MQWQYSINDLFGAGILIKVISCLMIELWIIIV